MGKRKIKYFILGAVTFLISVIFMLNNYTDGFNVDSYTHDYKEGTIDLSNLENNGYDISGSKYKAIVNDPNLTMNNVDSSVKYVNFTFSEIKSPLNIVIYYDFGEGLSEEHTVQTQLHIVDKQTVFSLELPYRSKIKSLRMDIGLTAGEEFELTDITFDNGKVTISEALSSMFTGINRDRFIIIYLLIFFVGLHFIVNMKSMYAFIFNKRYYIAVTLFLFLNVNQYHTSSVGLYNDIIQPGEGSEYIMPVFGEPRPIRTDEWAVRTPAKLSRQYGNNMYDKYNTILRGTESVDTSLTEVTSDISVLKNPFNLGMLLFGPEIGFGFETFGRIISTFIIGIEFFLILTKKNKIISCVGATMVTFSSYIFWWNIYWVMPLMGFFVCIFHYVNYGEQHQESCMEIKKWSLAIGAGIFASGFVCVLYPAFQVPAAYIILSLCAWIFTNYWKQIKAFDKHDYMKIGVAILMFLIISIVYLLDLSEYNIAIMNTVYPGRRINTGGNGLSKLFNYFSNSLLPYKEFTNQSEAATFLTFFPLPIIIALLCWWKKKDKKDIIFYLLVVLFPLLIYSVFGFPELLAKLTLMSYTIGERNDDICGFIQIILIIICMSRLNEQRLTKKHFAILISILIMGLGWHYVTQSFGNAITFGYSLYMLVVTFSVCMLLLCSNSKRAQHILSVILVSVSLGSTMTIHPLMKTFDVIKSKPLSLKIQEITEMEPESKWIAYDNTLLSGFMVSSGASTYNSVNFYPNFDFWNKIDPDKQYEDVYNRYAHITFVFTEEETHVETLYPDAIKLELNYNDLPLIDVDYICSLYPLNDRNELKLIYEESGAYIYQVTV